MGEPTYGGRCSSHLMPRPCRKCAEDASKPASLNDLPAGRMVISDEVRRAMVEAHKTPGLAVSIRKSPEERIYDLRRSVRTGWLTGVPNFRELYDKAIFSLLGIEHFQDLYEDKAKPETASGAYVGDGKDTIAAFPYINGGTVIVKEVPPAEKTAEQILKELRDDGLMVAVHNDYKLVGEKYTFWLMTEQSGMSYKGEGMSDLDALKQLQKDFEASKKL